MEIITGERGSGKTTELIKRSAKTGFYILVSNRTRAERLAKMAREMECDIPFPITLEEYLKGSRFRNSSIRRNGLFIDDVEDVLKELFEPMEIKAVTYTKPEGSSITTNLNIIRR